MGQRHFIRSAKLIAALTMVSRVLGLLRDMICVRYFGTAVFDSFTVPFQIPNLFRRLFGEGALSAAMIPVYTRTLQEDPARAAKLAKTVMLATAGLLAGITLIGWVGLMAWRWIAAESISDTGLLRVHLTMVMLPYMILICQVGLRAGLLNVHGRFGAPAAAPVLLNVCMIAAVAGMWAGGLADRQTGLYALAAAVLTAGVLQVLMLRGGLGGDTAKIPIAMDLHDPALKEVMHRSAPMIVGLSIMQINALADSLVVMAASPLTEGVTSFTWAGHEIAYPMSVGSLSAMYVAQRLYQLPLGVFGIALATAIFPALAAAAAKKDHDNFAVTINQGLRMVCLIALPAAAGIVLLRVPLAGMFQGGRFGSDDTARTAWPLLFYAMGIPAYCLSHIVTRGFYAMGDVKTPVKLAVKIMIANVILNVTLIWPLGVGGPALATAACATVQVVILLIILKKRYNLALGYRLRQTLVGTVAGTILMSAVGFAVLHVVRGQHVAVQLIAVTVACAAVYAAMVRGVARPEWELLIKSKKRDDENTVE